MDRIIDVLWPEMIGEQGMAGRFGRLLFWFGLGFGSLLAASGVLLAIISDPSGALPLLLAFWAGGLVVYLAGRGFCYWLAGE